MNNHHQLVPIGPPPLPPPPLNQPPIDINNYNDIPSIPVNALAIIDELRNQILALYHGTPQRLVLVYLNRNGGILHRPCTNANHVFRFTGIMRALKTARMLLSHNLTYTQRFYFYANELCDRNPDGIYRNQDESDADIIELADMTNLPRLALGFISNSQLILNFLAPYWVNAGYSVEDMWIRCHFGMLDMTVTANVHLTWVILIEDMGE